MLAFVGFWYAARQQKKLNREDAEELAEARAAGFDEPIHKVRKIRAKQTKKYRRDGSLTDEAVEDAMLDQGQDRPTTRTRGSAARSAHHIPTTAGPFVNITNGSAAFVGARPTPDPMQDTGCYGLFPDLSYAEGVGIVQISQVALKAYGAPFI